MIDDVSDTRNAAVALELLMSCQKRDHAARSMSATNGSTKNTLTESAARTRTNIGA